jgi:hypothetical protein
MSIRNCYYIPDVVYTPQVQTRPIESNAPKTSEVTIEDIFIARDMFRSIGLPLEIVSIIFNMAEYWCKQTYSRSTPLDMFVRHLDVIDNTSLYLQTGPLGYGESFDELPYVHVWKVCFWLVSRDPSIGAPPGTEGTYRNAWSWFDASIFRPDKSWHSEDRIEPIQALREAVPDGYMLNIAEDERGESAMFYEWNTPYSFPLWFSPDGQKVAGGFQVVKNGEKQMWLLQRNIVSFWPFSEHGVEWTRDKVKEFKEILWPSNGCGHGINFVSSLKRGDRIGVWAKAAVGISTLERLFRLLFIGTTGEEHSSISGS